jgi:phospholipid/cholesterol/gamma-HCH transport system permease protein
MPSSLVKRLGSAAIVRSLFLFELLYFIFECFYLLFKPSSYSQATKTILVRQIYFTSVQILPFFIFLCIVVGSALISAALSILKQMGLLDYFGSVMVGIVITEVAPLMSVFLIALRSSSAINAEIAVMKVNGELNTLKAFGISHLNYLVIPRILNGMISLTLLTFLFATITVCGGFIISFIFSGATFDSYINTIIASVNFYQIAVMFVKSMAFGFFITVIPIFSGLRASGELTAIPIAVLHGMVRVFNAIIIIEGLALAARFI